MGYTRLLVAKVCQPLDSLALGPERRAHVLREGALTMVAYGADEVLTWHKRVGTFQNAMRCVMPARLPVGFEEG